MPSKTSKYEFYFDDPRLRMTIAGRILVRVISYVSYLVLVVATLVFLLARDIKPLFYMGMLLVLVLADLLIHRGEGDTPISELPEGGRDIRVNLADVMNSAAFSVIERAVDRSRKVRVEDERLLGNSVRLAEVHRCRAVRCRRPHGNRRDLVCVPAVVDRDRVAREGSGQQDDEQARDGNDLDGRRQLERHGFHYRLAIRVA